MAYLAYVIAWIAMATVVSIAIWLTGFWWLLFFMLIPAFLVVAPCENGRKDDGNDEK